MSHVPSPWQLHFAFRYLQNLQSGWYAVTSSRRWSGLWWFFLLRFWQELHESSSYPLMPTGAQIVMELSALFIPWPGVDRTAYS